MASPKHRKEDRLKPFFDALPRVVNGALLLCALFNFLVVFWGVSHTSPKVVHSIDTFTTNHWFVVTQVVERVSSSASPSIGVNPVVERIGAEVVAPYGYMEVDGRPMIQYCGRPFAVGDSISYGRIEAIYPDRVRLSDGLFLKNQKFEGAYKHD